MFSTIINIISLFQIIFFTVFLLFKRSKKIGNKILIVFLISQGAVYINVLGFFFCGYIYKTCLRLALAGQTFSFLWAPMLYLYVCSLTTSNFKSERKHLLHFVPFIASLLFLFFTFCLEYAGTNRQIIDVTNITFYYRTWNILSHIQILAYIVIALIRLRRFSFQIKSNGDELSRINRNWLQILVYSYIACWLIALSSNVLDWLSVSPSGILHVVICLFFLTFFSILVFKALTTPEIFRDSGIQLKEKRKSLSEIKRMQYLVKLEKYVREHKPYLSPTVTLNGLAEMTDIPPRSLSEVLNDSLGQSFFDYINVFRVNEAEQLLLNSKDSALTVSEVIYDVGFNSKSAFYSAYKKHKGYSPCQFKQIRNTPGEGMN